MAFSPDGRTLAGIAEQSGEIYTWHVATGKQKRLIGRHLGGRAVCFSADGSLLASAGNDTTALVWDVAERRAPSEGSITAADLSARWTELAQDDAERADQAVRLLEAFPKQTLPFLRERLHPVPAGDLQQVEDLIVDLGSDHAEVRKRAAAGLEKLGELAIPALRSALKNSGSPEVRRQLALLLEEADPIIFALPIERLRAARSVEILERIGSPEARDLLGHLAKGAPQAVLTQEARAAYRRLSLQNSRLP